MKAYNLNQLHDHHMKIYVKLIHTHIHSEDFEKALKRYRNTENIIQDQLKRGSKHNWLKWALKWIVWLKNRVFIFTRVDKL